MASEHRARESICNKQVMKKEQLGKKKNLCELILGIKDGEGYHFQRLSAPDVPTCLLSVVIEHSPGCTIGSKTEAGEGRLSSGLG